MALVFKIKHEDTLRRWVVSESVDAEMFPITLQQLQAKVRELFQFPPASELVITYVDKDNDVVTLGDDGDLLDACVVQHLNPLRLEVQVLESKANAAGSARDGSQPTADPLNVEGLLTFLFPQATSEALQRFLQRYAQLLDPSLSIATLITKAQDAFKESVVHAAAMAEGQKGGTSEKSGHHHPYKHPCGDVRFKAMPTHGDHSSWKEACGLGALHLGVKCDSCGATPIQGPRYKSNKIPDYDLCSSCYQEKGNEDGYEKMEYPLQGLSFHDFRHYRPPCLRKGLKQFMGHPMCGRGAFARGSYGWRPEHGFGHDEHKKLEARFVKDVTIFDGTELAPGTKFTKIWRMSNNGSQPWPVNTQLLHIGGDVLSLQEAIDLELPESGLACGEEVDVSVDLTAPEKAGRYTSHWRLVSPAGRKFGERVWVTIHVVPQGEQSPLLQESLKGGEVTGNQNNGSVTFAVPFVSMVDDEKEAPLNPERKDEMMAENAAGPSSRDVIDIKITEFVPDISEELEGFFLVEKPKNPNDEEMVDNADERNEQELKLQSLEAMGFMDRELNGSLLKKNGGNVQLTLDDLLAAAGWDGALRDLQEMGFTDQATNMKFLMKHSGSIKAVVKELLQMGKQKA